MRSRRVISLSVLATVIAVGVTITIIGTSQQGRHTGTDGRASAVVPTAGTADRAVAVPLPYGAAPSAESTLDSITCPAPLACVATGWYLDASGNAQGLLVTTDGAFWQSQTAPLPSDASPKPNAQFDGKGSLACPTPTECVAIGSYETTLSASNPQSMIVTGSGSNWKAIRTPLPSDADPTMGSSLNAVTCPAPSVCIAVGSYMDKAGNGHGLLVTGSGSSWTASRAPQPADVPRGQSADIGSVTCTSASRCVAVANYSEISGDYQGFLLSGSGTSWKSAKPPLFANTAPNGASGQTTPLSLGSTACPAPSSCIALGSIDQTEYPRSVLLTVANGKWKAHTAPIPSGTDAPYGTNTDSIACPSASRCVITGSYTDAYKYSHAMIITGSATEWKATGAPLPAGGDTTDPSSLTDITCPSHQACIAIGEYTDRHGYEESMLITGSTTSWASTEIFWPSSAPDVKTPGPFPTGFQAVACFTTGECMAAGSYANSSGQSQAMLVGLLPGPHPLPDLYITASFTIGLYTFPGFPSFIGLDNHSYISKIRWNSVSAETAQATGTLTTDNCKPSCASGRPISYPIKLLASAPRQCIVGKLLTPPVAVSEYLFSEIDIVGQSPGPPAYLLGTKLLSLNCRNSSL